MDISVSAMTTAYVPTQAYSPQGVVAVAAQASLAANVASNNTQAPASSTSGQTNSQSQANTTDIQSAASKQTRNARTQDTANVTSSVANFTFEVDQQNHRILKLSDGNGVLIYQIPSKGQLALISAQENEQKRIALVA